MATKDQKNIKSYVNLTKSMLNEQLDTQDQEQPPPLPPEAGEAGEEEEKLRKSTADNILRYLNSNESASEQNIKKVIQIANDPSKFDDFHEKIFKIFNTANIKIDTFGKKVLNTSKLSLVKGIKTLDTEIDSVITEQADIDSAFKYIAKHPEQANDFLTNNPEYDRNISRLFNKRRDGRAIDSNELDAKSAYKISKLAKQLKANHLKNIRRMAQKLKSSKLDPMKVFSRPENADVFAEMRTVYTILTILQDFDQVGKNLEGEADEQAEYLKIITPQRMTELYGTSRKEFNKIITTFIKGTFAAAASQAADIERARSQRVGSFSAAGTGKLEEILSSYQNKLLEIEIKLDIEEKEDWYDKLRDKTHEYRITFDDWTKCFGVNEKKKLRIFGLLLSSPPERVEKILDKMEKDMAETEGRCRPDPEAQIPFMESKNIIKEELTIHNETGNDLSEFTQVASEFYPYSKQNLGFDRPVSLRLVSDLDNSQNTFGKTAHYDPNSMEIVIYTDNRHPKDMLRSLSHELVHHAQNCRGDFDNDHSTEDGYAQNDPYMREKEAEAYLVGNGFMVRDYEDSLKEKNKMLSEEKIREMVREGLKKALFEQTEVQEGEKPDFLDVDKDGDKEESMKDATADADEDETVDEAHCPGKRDDDTEEDTLQEIGRHDPDSGYDELRQDRDDEEADRRANDEQEEVEEASTKDVADRVAGRDQARRLRPLEETELTVEGRLQEKNDFLFEKLTKMWTK